MESREERLARLRQASRESANAANELLAGELAALQQATQSDLGALRPRFTDPAAFDQLIAAVEEATRANETREQFRQRLAKLGTTVTSVAKVAASMLT